ncbi:UNKNOWN [Stylonychia lemnae]|uniref:Uncharacterized protein n=1 Tax=Stylonychia lemnae TaxID=5949 RepID=A0A078A4S2_STYLE|nr:UNKNOWN [Stylonychia lemnae]|eukprot:CDW77172.1 UNKNOWN [Stylonychia lemnae]
MEYRTITNLDDTQSLIVPLIGSNLDEIRYLRPSNFYGDIEISKIAIACVNNTNQQQLLALTIIFAPQNWNHKLQKDKPVTFILNTRTTIYASVNQLKGYTISRKDDIESLFYTLVVLSGYKLEQITDENQVNLVKKKKFEGTALESYQELMSYYLIKSCISEESLLKSNLPFTLILLWKHIQKMLYEDEPNYQYLITLFQSNLSALDDPDKIVEIDLFQEDQLWSFYHSIFEEYKQSRYVKNKARQESKLLQVNQEIDFEIAEENQTNQSIEEKLCIYDRSTKCSILQRNRQIAIQI